MSILFNDSELKDLIEKVESGIGLEFNDGIRLLKSNDILALGHMANIIRERKNQDITYYSVNQHSKKDATIIYGYNESPEELVDHIFKIKSLQDETGGIISVLPLPYQQTSTGFGDLKILSSIRILIDNVNHVTASWKILGAKLAQVSLAFGVDVLDGSVIQENEVTNVVDTESAINSDELIRMIEKAGKRPIERDW